MRSDQTVRIGTPSRCFLYACKFLLPEWPGLGIVQEILWW